MKTLLTKDINIVMEYSGPVQFDTIGELIHELKDKSQKLALQTNVYKKILLVMIESLENIIKHNEYPLENNFPETYLYPSIKIEKYQNAYKVISSNLVQNTNVPDIKDKINYLNKLDQQGLKDFYKEIIMNGKFTHKGGAGLGLIEMAKISTHKIAFEFLKVNPDYSRYTLQVIIDD